MRLLITLDDAEVAALSTWDDDGKTLHGREALVEFVKDAADPESQGATLYFADKDETLTVHAWLVLS